MSFFHQNEQELNVRDNSWQRRQDPIQAGNLLMYRFHPLEDVKKNLKNGHIPVAQAMEITKLSKAILYRDSKSWSSIKTIYYILLVLKEKKRVR